MVKSASVDIDSLDDEHLVWRELQFPGRVSRSRLRKIFKRSNDNPAQPEITARFLFDSIIDRLIEDGRVFENGKDFIEANPEFGAANVAQLEVTDIDQFGTAYLQIVNIANDDHPRTPIIAGRQKAQRHNLKIGDRIWGNLRRSKHKYDNESYGADVLQVDKIMPIHAETDLPILRVRFSAETDAKGKRPKRNLRSLYRGIQGHFYTSGKVSDSLRRLKSVFAIPANDYHPANPHIIIDKSLRTRITKRDLETIARNNGLRTGHTKRIEAQAAKAVKHGQSAKNIWEHPARVDLRHIPLIAIDEEGSTPEDLIHLEPWIIDGKQVGFIETCVISDFTPYVTPGSDLDYSAMKHGENLYTPLGAYTVLPEKTMKAASFEEGQDALGFFTRTFRQMNGTIDHVEDGICIARNNSQMDHYDFIDYIRAPENRIYQDWLAMMRKNEIINTMSSYKADMDPHIRDAYDMVSGMNVGSYMHFAETLGNAGIKFLRWSLSDISEPENYDECYLILADKGYEIPEDREEFDKNWQDIIRNILEKARKNGEEDRIGPLIRHYLIRRPQYMTDNDTYHSAFGRPYARFKGRYYAGLLNQRRLHAYFHQRRIDAGLADQQEADLAKIEDEKHNIDDVANHLNEIIEARSSFYDGVRDYTFFDFFVKRNEDKEVIVEISKITFNGVTVYNPATDIRKRIKPDALPAGWDIDPSGQLLNFHGQSYAVGDEIVGRIENVKPKKLTWDLTFLRPLMPKPDAVSVPTPS